MRGKRSLLLCAISLVLTAVQAQSWLPEPGEETGRFRLLECTYDKAKLKKCGRITSGSLDWEVRKEHCSLSPEKDVYTFVFKAKRPLSDAGVAVAFDCRQWSSDNYVMVPASVYNGNRQRIVNRSYATGLDASDYGRNDLALTSNPIPQLSPEFGADSRFEVNVSNAATPAMVYFERQKRQGTILLTDQGISLAGGIRDHALIVEESPDRSMASFVISAPGVREKKPEFIGFSESPDRGVTVNAGDEITIRVTRISFPNEHIPSLLSRFLRERKTHTKSGSVRNLMPMSEVLARMVENIDERYLAVDEWEYYCPENADWISFGWVGGLINTYPMLALGDDEHFRRVKNTFDFAIPRAQEKTGYFYGTLGADGKPFGRDAAKDLPHVVLTRKNADVLYWMVKQFMLLKGQGRDAAISPDWENGIRRLADAFATTWNQSGTWGNYMDVKTGKIAVHNTTSGAMAVGGLALASVYYDNPDYLRVALQAAKAYYESYALVGFTSGGCGDILQNADSETAAALMTSFMTLYEVTGDRRYLEQAAGLADLCATWIVSFDYRLSDNTPLAKLGANLTGAVWASTQNKHGAPGFCTQSGDALFKLFRATGEVLYAELLRDVIHAHAEGVQPNGKITERLTYCDADSRGSRGDGGKTGWNETNGALMALEIPGIYVRTDLGTLYVFDHVEATITGQNGRLLTLRLVNPTTSDATVTILAEDKEKASRPLGENGFLKWKDKVTVKAGKTTVCKLNIN